MTRPLLFLLLLVACAREAPAPLRVAAASDLTVAFEEMGTAYAATGKPRPVFSFGATGLLAKQIREGAPFDVFAAADVSFIDGLLAAGNCDAATKQPYAVGRLTIWTSTTSTLAPPTSLADLAEPRFARIAIANPEHAPYGRAAREALQKAGIWETVESRIVRGENVRQALQYAESGNADVAVVAHASASAVKNGRLLEVDPALHAPILQAMVVCATPDRAPAARDFAAFVRSDPGRAVLRRHGFGIPGESAP